MMEYKGYLGHVEFDADANLFHGEVVGMRDVVTFQGRSVSELRRAFEESVDDYLAFCRKRREAPERPFSGKFLLRIDPELHRRLSVAAKGSETSLNAWIAEQLREAVKVSDRRGAVRRRVVAKKSRVGDGRRQAQRPSRTKRRASSSR
jgi:predicted HicB family RNase H-like nuclease